MLPILFLVLVTVVKQLTLPTSVSLPTAAVMLVRGRSTAALMRWPTTPGRAPACPARRTQDAARQGLAATYWRDCNKQREL